MELAEKRIRFAKKKYRGFWKKKVSQALLAQEAN
jgi:hypothetical protein